MASFSQYTLVDTPLARGGDRFGTWQGGLRFADGTPKPGVLRGLPPADLRAGCSARAGWRSGARPGPGGGGAVVQVQQRAGKGAFNNLGAPITVKQRRAATSARASGSAEATRRTYRIQSSGSHQPRDQGGVNR